MNINIETHDTSVEIRNVINKNKTLNLEVFIFFPSDMEVKERGIDASVLFALKSSRYHYSISKARLPLLKQKRDNAESNIDYPMFLKAFKIKLSGFINSVNSEDIHVDAFINIATSLLRELRATPVNDSTISDFRTADELCSYYAEQIAFNYHEIVKCKGVNEVELQNIINFTKQESEYRRKLYGLKYKEAQYVRRKEDYFCRKIDIKSRSKRLGVFREQIVFSLSAFLSMLFTTLIVFYFQKGYGNFSFAVLMAFCLSYIFKDRFKELFRNYVAKEMSKGKFSHEVNLSDSEDNLIGRCREMIEFVQPNNEILNKRAKGKYTKKDSSEDVILYHKKYELTDNFINGFTQIRDTIDINFNYFLDLLPDTTLDHISLEGGELIRNKYSLLHDINMIIRVNNEKVERYRFKVSCSRIVNLALVRG